MNSFIISAPDREAACARALEMAAEATGSREKVMKFIHPDVTIIRAGEGKAKSEIGVDQVRAVVADAAVLPNESRQKVYIFLDGDLMNVSAQNTVLKLLEEPPDYVMMILCAPSADVFLPTIRSRCQETVLNTEAVYDADTLASAESILQALASGDSLALYTCCESIGKIGISECETLLTVTRSVICDMLCARRPDLGLPQEKLLAFDALLEKCLKYLAVNVSVKQIFGLIEVFQ